MPEAINIEVTQPITRVAVTINTGLPGPGVAPGGTTGQVLAKASGADYDTEWVDQEAGGPGGAVSSVFGRTGAVTAQSGDYTADQVTETATRVFVTPTQKSELHTHANKSILNAIQEALTTALKSAYDNVVNWVSTNGSNLINHLSNTSNPHSVTKSQVGLGNVDNTSDADKPISTAQQTALDQKAPTSHTHTASQVTDFAATVAANTDVAANTAARHTHANKTILDSIQEALTTALKSAYDSVVTWVSTNGSNLINHLSNTSNPHSVTKSQVGLGNADNTSDADKPISTATQTALDARRTFARTTNGNSDYSIPSSTRVAATSAAFTAPRIWTLPAASSVPAGEAIEISDAFGGVSSTNTLTVQRAGSDSINGGTSIVIAAAYGARRFVSNGVNAWAFDAGVLRASNNLNDVANAASARTNLGAQATIGTTFSALSGTVSMPSASTWYTGTSINLTAGTYLVSGQINITVALGNAVPEARITDGTTVYSSNAAQPPGIGSRNTPISLLPVPITLTGSATLSIQGYLPTINATINGSTPSGQPNATFITAIKIA